MGANKQLTARLQADLQCALPANSVARFTGEHAIVALADLLQLEHRLELVDCI